MPTAVVLSHRDIAHELGLLGEWLAANDYEVERVYREDDPSLPEADLLVVMGSPESVADGHTQPRAASEIEQVRAWLEADRPYLGICFGAQVLARAKGGSVHRLAETFRGYVPVDAARPVAGGPWTIWHNDAITAPADADIVASLDHADLIFRVGRAWGVQPHIEVTPQILDRMGIALGATEDERGPLVTDLGGDTSAAERTRQLLDSLLRG